MLYIVSGSKPQKLNDFLSPILGDAGIPTKVVTLEALEECDVTNQDVVLLMGAKAFGLLASEGVVKAKQKIGSCREKVFHVETVPVLVTYDVNLIDFMPELEQDIRWDIHLALRLAVTGKLTPTVGDYEWVDNFLEVQLWASTMHAQHPSGFFPLALDLETLGLDEFATDGRILTVQISCMPTKSYVYRVPEEGLLPLSVKVQLAALFETSYLNFVGANLKYDMRWLYRHWGLVIENHRFDTQLVGGLLNENRYNSLKAHVKEYAPELGGYETEFEEKHDKAKMQVALATDPAGFLQYAGGDTDGAMRIYTPLRKALLKDQTLARFYTRLLHPASLAFRQLESRGICIDQSRYLQLEVEAAAEKLQLSEACFNLIPNKIKYKYADNLSLTRDVIVRDFLFGADGLALKPKMFTDGSAKLEAQGKDAIPSCSWEHLKMFADHKLAGPFVTKLKEYNAVSKTLSTYIVGFLKHLRSDGRFHPSYVLAKGGQAGDEDEGGGTNTGRSSCKDPAYQTWPKRTSWAKRLRSVVIPPPGHVLGKLDFSQGELRIMADAANCKAMIQAYLEGKDLHAITAADFMNMSVEQLLKLPPDQLEQARYLAKAGNFGLIYAISPEGFRQFAATSYNVIMTLQEAEKYHSKFFEKYPEIETYHTNQKTFAKKHLYVRNQLGRVRHLPLINSYDAQIRSKQERQAINAPTQGCLFDMMMLLMVQIDRFRPDIWVFGNTHDSLEMYLKEDTWQQDMLHIKEMAETLPLADFGWQPKVPFTVDFEVGMKHLGDMKKVKFDQLATKVA